jgi:hypothetical protein
MLLKLLAAFVASIASKLAVISPAIASGTSIAVPLALSKVLVICFDWLACMASIPSSPRATIQCSMMVCSSMTRMSTMPSWSMPWSACHLPRQTSVKGPPPRRTCRTWASPCATPR